MAVAAASRAGAVAVTANHAGVGASSAGTSTAPSIARGASAADHSARRQAAASALAATAGQRCPSRARKRRAKLSRSTWPSGSPASSWSSAFRSCHSSRPSSAVGAHRAR
jgi:hypothetical protein